jgi:hypothetical protein
MIKATERAFCQCQGKARKEWVNEPPETLAKYDEAIIDGTE